MSIDKILVKQFTCWNWSIELLFPTQQLLLRSFPGGSSSPLPFQIRQSLHKVIVVVAAALLLLLPQTNHWPFSLVKLDTLCLHWLSTIRNSNSWAPPPSQVTLSSCCVGSCLSGFLFFMSSLSLSLSCLR